MAPTDIVTNTKGKSQIDAGYGDGPAGLTSRGNDANLRAALPFGVRSLKLSTEDALKMKSLRNLFLVGLVIAGAGTASLLIAQDAASGAAPVAAPVVASPAADPAVPAATATEELKVGKSIENLQTAFNGESNARERYTAFAKKADEEGFKGVASLFRAAAKAEEVHAAAHKAVIEKMGGKAEAKLDPVTPKTTKENLEAAIKGETYERDIMYPKFAEVADSEENDEALKTINYAKAAEAEHVKLYTEALAKMDTLKDKQVDYFVCQTCGQTVLAVPAACPVCASKGEKFLKVN